MDLYEFQEEVLKKVENRNKVAFYLDMGLGKTFVGAEKMRRLGAKRNLLICQKSKIDDWKNHFEMYYKTATIFDLTKPKELDVFLKFLKDPQIPCVGIVNYELAWRRPEILQLSNFTLMLDESSLIQNRKAKQTKFILKLKPKNIILLSGTPTSGKYENLWTQMHLLGWEISEHLYNQHYVNWKTLQIGWTNPRFIRVVDKKNPYKNVSRLKAQMREYGSVFLKTEDVLDLPEQIVTVLKLSRSKEYVRFKKDSILKIGDTELVCDTDLTKRLGLRQLCGVFSSEKLQAFEDLIQSTNDRLIVFYCFNAELEKLKKVAEKLKKPISIVNGDKKDFNSYETEDDSVTFVQYQAGAMGLNLQKANKIVYFTLPDGRQDLFDQSKKRIHRIGQSQPCFYYILLCDNTVECEILKTLDERTALTNNLFLEES